MADPRLIGGTGENAAGTAGTDEAALKSEAMALAARIGQNPYSEFLLKHNQRPNRDQAATIGVLIGRRVRAADGSLQPRPSKHERRASKKAKLAHEAGTRVDLELSRALDAVSFLAQNELDPNLLLARMSQPEAELMTGRIEKAVGWLNRFASGWGHYVQIADVEIEERPSKHTEPSWGLGPRLIYCCDSGG